MRILRNLVLIIAVSVLVAFSQTPKPNLVIWEYKFEFQCTEKKANQLGAEGWELVAIQPPSNVGISNNISTYVFKRAKN